MDKILIIDHSQQDIDILSQYLQNNEYTVYCTSLAETSLRRAKILKPSLIILDLHMPTISGFDICKMLKNDSDTKDIMILMMSNDSSREDRKRGFAVGVDEFLEKPIDNDLLLVKIKSLIRLRHLDEKLKFKYLELEEKNKQIELQLELARQIQTSLIYNGNNNVCGVDVTSKYLPALYIGGDIFDIYKLNEDAVCIFLADVSGHGISAALITSMIKMLFVKTFAEFPRPDNLFEKMNDEFNKILPDSDVFACAFSAYIDLKHKRITYSNSGLPFPVFFSKSEEAIYDLAIEGVPLGMLENSTYEYKTINFSEGDLMLFYTDGLPDCFHKNTPDKFTEELKEIIYDYKDEDGDIILEEIIEHFYDVKGKQAHDDVSVILCKM